MVSWKRATIMGLGTPKTIDSSVDLHRERHTPSCKRGEELAMQRPVVGTFEVVWVHVVCEQSARHCGLMVMASMEKFFGGSSTLSSRRL